MAIFVAISYQGLSFFPTQNFYSEKPKYTAPKENQWTTLLHFNGFCFSRNNKFVFLIEKRRDVELIFIAI